MFRDIKTDLKNTDGFIIEIKKQANLRIELTKDSIFYSEKKGQVIRYNFIKDIIFLNKNHGTKKHLFILFKKLAKLEQYNENDFTFSAMRYID